jgi:hypothetical protein
MATKKIKTQYSYDFVGELKEGMAVVRNNGKYGFVNKTGKEIVPPIYDFASDFKNGKAEVKFKNQLRTIDSEGKTISKIEIELKLKSENNSNVALIEKKVIAIELPEKEEITEEPLDSDLVEFKKNEEPFNSDLVKFKKYGKWGLKDLSGNVIMPPMYNAFAEFGNGLIKVKKSRKWGLVNMSGEEVTEIKYDEISDGVIRVGKLWGEIDENGNEIVTPKYYNFSSLFKSKDEFRKDLLNS